MHTNLPSISKPPFSITFVNTLPTTTPLTTLTTFKNSDQTPPVCYTPLPLKKQLLKHPQNNPLHPTPSQKYQSHTSHINVVIPSLKDH
jgi:hypothetical protein